MSSAAAPPTRFRGRLARLLAVCTAAYAVVLVLATHYPQPEHFLGKNPPSDKTLHFIAYGTLAVLAAATSATAGRWTPRQVAGLAAFAAVDEITQPLFSRALERLDWVYDCLGIALGLAVVATMCAVVRGCYRQLGVGGR